MAKPLSGGKWSKPPTFTPPILLPHFNTVRVPNQQLHIMRRKVTFSIQIDDNYLMVQYKEDSYTISVEEKGGVKDKELVWIVDINGNVISNLKSVMPSTWERIIEELTEKFKEIGEDVGLPGLEHQLARLIASVAIKE